MSCSTMDDALSAAATVTLQDDARPAYVARLPPGTTIGHFVVVGHLGSGGMGSVYAAFDVQLQRRTQPKRAV